MATNMAKLLDEIHPGEILLEDFMRPLGITGHQLAADINMALNHINEIVNGKLPISAETSRRLGLFFGMEEKFWLHLQSEYDRRMADRRSLI
jgi:addiction module HigA family antidote